LYILISYHFSYDYPLNADDIVICISDVMSIVDEGNSYFDYLLMTKNNNPTIVLRLINLLNYLITGKINFLVIPVVANICVAIFSFYLSRKYVSLPFSFLIPLLLLVPTAQYMYWSSAAASYTFTVMFLYSCMVQINNVKNFGSFPLLVLTMFLLTYSFANGFVGCCFIILYALYLMFFSDLQKKYGVLIIVIALTYITLFMTYTEKSDIGVDFTEKKLQFILPFCGNLFRYIFENWFFAGSVAFLIIGYLSVLFYKNFRNTSTTILFFMVGFVCATSLIVSLSRCQSVVLCNPFFVRYEIFGVAFCLFAFLAILKLGNKKFIYPFVVMIMLSLVIKAGENFDLLQKGKYNLVMFKTIGAFDDNYRIKVFNKAWLEISKIAYLKALNEDYIDRVKPQNSIKNKIKDSSIISFNDNTLKLYKRVLKKDDFMLLRGELFDEKSKNVFVKIDGDYYELEVFVNPTINKRNNFDFYTILPVMDSEEYQIVTN